MKQKKSISRIISLALVCVFLLAMVPFSAVAADDPPAAPKFPEPKDLPIFDEFLPNPFQFYGEGGRMVVDQADWYANRVPELKELAAYYEYGTLPTGNQRVVTASITSYTASNRTLALSVTVTNQENGVSETITTGRVVLPTAAAQTSIAGPYPIVIGTNSAYGNAATLQSAGYATGFISNTFSDNLTYTDATDAFFRLYPIADYDVGSYIGWAWQASVLLDAIEYLAANNVGFTVDSVERKIRDVIDPTKAAVTGMSRWGKAAFAAGLFDTRFGVTIPEDSGSGGSGVYRVAFDRVAYPWGGGDTCEMIRDLQQRFPQWSNRRHLEFTKDYSDCKYLPYDKNELVAAFAPRGIFNTTCIGNYWGNPEGVYLSHTEAKAVYQWLGVPNNIALSIQPTGHSSLPALNASTQYLQSLIDFMDYYFRGKTPDPESTTVNGLVRNATAPGTLPIEVGPLPAASGTYANWTVEQLAATPFYKPQASWATTRPLGAPDEVVGIKSDTYLVDRQAFDGKTNAIPVIVKAINAAGKKIFADLYINGVKAQTKEVIVAPGAANGYANFDALIVDKNNTYRLEAYFEGSADKLPLDLEVVPYNPEWFEARVGQRYNATNATSPPTSISSHGIGGVTYGNGCYTIEFSNHEHSWDVNQRNWTRVGHTDDYKVTINGVNARAIVRDYEGPYKCCFTLVPDGPIPGADANNNLPVDAPLHIVFEGITFPEFFPGESFTIDIDHRNQRILQHSSGQRQWINWDTQDVTRVVDGNNWIISNGLITATMTAIASGTGTNQKAGAITSVKVGDDDANYISNIYIDAHLNQYSSATVNILEETPQKLHIVLDYPYNPTNFAQGGDNRIRAQRHYVFLPGLEGYYEYVIADTPVQKGGVAEFRTIYNLNSAALNMRNMYNGELNRAHVAASGGSLPGWAGGLGSVRTGFTTANWRDAGPRDYYTKYDLPGYLSETPSFGIYGSGRGAFLIYGSSEYYSGGPYKQEMLVEPTIIENYMSGGHSGGQVLNPPAGWSKIYGPWLMYFSNEEGATDEEVVADMKAQAAQEQAKWPYDFVVGYSTPENGRPDFTGIYPKADERATVTGKIEATGGHSLAGAMVILSEPGVSDLLRIVNNYYFHSFADASGNFTIKNVRPGQYSLFVIPQGGSLTGQYKSEAITIVAGAQDIGTHTWVTAAHNNYLFQIGTSDRRTTGFGGMMDAEGKIDRSVYYQVNAPGSLSFDVNTNLTKDWYYAQPFRSSYATASYNTQGIPTGVWDIKFNSTKTYGSTATLHLGLAGVSCQPIYNVYVNGTLVETLYFSGIQDQAFYRQFSRSGRYIEREITFDASLLVNGENKITFENVSIEPTTQPLFNGGVVLYDVIYLTTDEPGNVASLIQLINNGVGAGAITTAQAAALTTYLGDGLSNAQLAGFLALLSDVGNDFKELLTFSATSIAAGAGADKAKLIELLDEALKRDQTNFSYNGKTAFTLAVSDAQFELAKAASTQEDVNFAVNNLIRVLDASVFRAPKISGYNPVYYNDFEEERSDYPWSFKHNTWGMHALMAGDVVVHGNDTRKLEVYTNGGSLTGNVIKTLPTPVNADKMLVTFDIALCRALTGNAAHTYDVRFLDGNGLAIVGAGKNVGVNIGAYAHRNRTGTTAATFADPVKLAEGPEFLSPDEWYNVTGVIDKVAKQITVTFTVLSGEYKGETDTVTFAYDPELTDGTISAIQVWVGSTQAGNAYFDNFGIYEGGYDPVVETFTVNPLTFVENNAAGLGYTITGSYIYDEVMSIELDGKYYHIDALSGIVRIDKMPAAGSYDVKLWVGDAVVKTFAITVVALPADIWSFRFAELGEGKLQLQFNAEIAAATKGLEVKVNGVTYPSAIEGVNAVGITCTPKAGDTFVVSGVKFPVLYPSYSFTFTQIYK